MKVLLVAEASAGHLIPAVQVARTLAESGAEARLWYAQRRQVSALAGALTGELGSAVSVNPLAVGHTAGLLGRLWRCGQLWSQASRCFDSFAPDVVVGFGGWVSAPVVLAARARGISCLVHEQNVVMGRANRLLSRLADRVAVSFPQTQLKANGHSPVMTGMPVRKSLGGIARADAAGRFGFSPDRPTLLVLGGSQGSSAVNRLVVDAVSTLSEQQCRQWQILHVAGQADAPAVAAAYRRPELSARVEPFLPAMDAAYAVADVAVCRAGASTIAELARCGLPSVLIPFPGAGAHQSANARVAEAIGGAVVIEEAQAGAEGLMAVLERLMAHESLRRVMGRQMRRLSHADAAERIACEIMDLAEKKKGKAF